MEKKKKNHEIDEEDMERIKKDLAKVGKVACQVMELTGQLVDIFKDRAFAVVRDNALPFFLNQLNLYAELTEDELLDALCFVCDYCEHTPASNDAKFVNDMGRKFLEICQGEVAEESREV